MAGGSTETYAGGKGSVRFNKSNGPRGMKNKRKAKKRKAKMLEIAERRRLQMEEAMKDGTYEDTYGWY
jgi:hypothetical protein